MGWADDLADPAGGALVCHNDIEPVSDWLQSG
jgi:hypothetical protein